MTLTRITITGADDKPVKRRRYGRPVRTDDGQKTCTSCLQLKPLDDFPLHKTSKDGRKWWCKSCHSASNALTTSDLRQAVFVHYSKGVPACACCNEREIAFLTIDHVNNDGAAHRRSGVGSGSAIYYWLRRNGFPEGFQVLCWNCQHGKQLRGGCPHQRQEGE